MTRDWIGETEMFLQERYSQVCSDQLPLKVKPPLDTSEAEFFLTGKERGLFLVDDEGYVQTQLLRPPLGKNRKQKTINLFWTRRNRKYLLREGICQLSSVASLIWKYGWNAAEIVMEPAIRDFGRRAYGVDVLIKDAHGTMICLEVKSSKLELQKLVEGFSYCCRIGRHERNECLFKKNHPKYDFCSEFKPLYFFATSPGREVLFKLAHDGQLVIEKQCEGLICREDVVGARDAQPIHDAFTSTMASL